ncbi:hypothetical protein [Neisseria sp. Ec49-e6-T10]|uniref:hypothetical protein n=1 Tax=Neisseria sp. Ec49-e6-T10 TaxID=3140744 RepID=UPI003EBC7571
MVRNDIYTTYNNREYVIARIDGHYELLSTDKEDLENNGFSVYVLPEYTIVNGKKYKFVNADRVSDNFYKIVSPTEVGEVYSIDTYGIYKNYKFSLSEHGEQYTLWTSDCEIAEKLGFDMLGRGDYEKLVPKSDIEHIYEVKEIIPDYFE